MWLCLRWIMDAAFCRKLHGIEIPLPSLYVKAGTCCLGFCTVWGSCCNIYRKTSGAEQGLQLQHPFAFAINQALSRSTAHDFRQLLMWSRERWGPIMYSMARSCNPLQLSSCGRIFAWFLWIGKRKGIVLLWIYSFWSLLVKWYSCWILVGQLREK